MKKLQITVNGKEYIVDVKVLQDDEASTDFLSGYMSAPSPAVTHHVASTPEAQPAYTHNPHTKSHHSGSHDNSLHAPLTGSIVEIYVRVGDTVTTGQPILAIEAMKMKTKVNSHSNAVVKTIEVRIGDNVEQDQIMITFE